MSSWAWISILLGAAVVSLVVVLLGVRRLALRRFTDRVIHDLPTGTYTLEFIREVYQAELRRAERTGVPFSVAFVAVHDLPAALHHQPPLQLDDLWVAMAQWLQSHLRGCDYVGRMDGDRFVLILPETWEDDARTVSRRINTSFRYKPKGSDDEIWMTCDVGIATWTPDEPDPWGAASKQLENVAAVARN